jgi:hypothetical protein
MNVKEQETLTKVHTCVCGKAMDLIMCMTRIVLKKLSIKIQPSLQSNLC